MGAIVGGLVAVLVGGGLAVATTVGVVSSVQDSPSSTDSQVVDYGTR